MTCKSDELSRKSRLGKKMENQGMQQSCATSSPEFTWANYDASVRCTSGVRFLSEDPMGLVNLPQAGGALFDMAVSGSGVVLSSFGLATGAAGIAAPEPLTTIAGAGLFALSSAGLTASSISFGLASGNLISAFVDDPGLGAIPSTNDLITNMLPNSPLTGPLVDIGMFGLDLTTGRAIGNLPNFLETAGNISDVGSVAGATESIIGSFGQISGNDSFFNFSNSASGGFVLYPNKINNNISNSVYSK